VYNDFKQEKTKLVGELAKQRSQKAESDIENSKHKLKNILTSL
jgi:hypothetical protein